MADFITRPLHSHGYAAGSPRASAWPQAGPPVAHVKVHTPSPQSGDGGVTPLTAAHAPIWSSEGAPFYNTGYVYPVHGPLVTGGAVALFLPPRAAMLDLTDMQTWDRPVDFGPGVA